MSFIDAFKQLVTLNFSTAVMRTEEVNRLDEDQKKCYDKIVSYLLDCCKDKLERNNQAASNDRLSGRQFMIVFRQSEKWEDVRKHLEKIDKKNIPWVTEWLNQLNYFKNTKSSLLEKRNELCRINKELEKSQVNQTSNSSREHVKAQKDFHKIHEDITSCQSTLNQIRQIVIKLIDHTKDLMTNGQLDQDCKDFLEFVQKNASELKSSMQWSSEPSDLQKLFVDIQEKTTAQKKGETNHLEVTSRVHFLIEEKLEENRISFKLQETNFTLIFANSEKLKDSFFWISPGRQQLRRSSSLAIIDENYSEIQSDQSIGDYYEIPSNGQRIKKIVDLALDNVNKCLAKNNLDEILATISNLNVIYIQHY